MYTPDAAALISASKSPVRPEEVSAAASLVVDVLNLRDRERTRARARARTHARTFARVVRFARRVGACLGGAG